MLLARAGSCDSCPAGDQASIAPFLFPNKLPQEAAAALSAATTSGGGAWLLSESDLSLSGPAGPLSIVSGVRGRNEAGVLNAVPADAHEREDFSWVPSLRDVVPGSQGFKAAYTSDDTPPGCVIAARLRFRSGKVFTYALARVDGKVRPIHFRPPSGAGPDGPYAQALATWVAAEIQVPGDVVEIVDTKFDDPESQRSIKLHPRDGMVELAVLNFPPFEVPADPGANRVPAAGQHFQLYYDLVRKPPARAMRVVPMQAEAPPASEAEIDWSAVHPTSARWSPLLEALGLSPRGSRGPYELAFCPMARE
ncbi:MAG: hypothetical protein JOZ54_04755 [Acidobacteria bacterium]|nr:hypothetical protein [Acidobacteriota bacterium]